jgi:diguanylate cyclase (GGDEF)-like protein
MAFDEMFSLEEKIIRHGERILEMDSSSDNLWKNEYNELLKHYKKMFKQLSRMIKINDRQQSKLSQANTILEKHSKYDELTGICNRRMFNEMYDREWRRCFRYSHVLSIVMFDIDHFKKVNDVYGHPAGDEILRIIATTLDKAARRVGDLAARLGGEEFVLLLPDTPMTAAFKIAEGVRKEIARIGFFYEDTTINVTISAGVASTVPDGESDPERLIKYADDALYLAKRTGRNRVKLYDEVCTEDERDA